MSTVTPHYDPSDVARLLSGFPVAQLMRATSALRFLQHTLTTVRELEPVLQRYPQVRYEPLDFIYVLLQAQGALDDHLMADLCHHRGWSGVLVASLLAALSPRAEYAAVLPAARDRAPHQQWAVDLALQELGAPGAEASEPLQQVVQELRSRLEPLVRPQVVLRRCPHPQQLSERAERVRQAYREGGLEAARQALNA